MGEESFTDVVRKSQPRFATYRRGYNLFYGLKDVALWFLSFFWTPNKPANDNNQ